MQAISCSSSCTEDAVTGRRLPKREGKTKYHLSRLGYALTRPPNKRGRMTGKPRVCEYHNENVVIYQR